MDYWIVVFHFSVITEKRYIFFSVIQASHEFLNGDTLITDKGPDGINITR